MTTTTSIKIRAITESGWKGILAAMDAAAVDAPEALDPTTMAMTMSTADETLVTRQIVFSALVDWTDPETGECVHTLEEQARHGGDDWGFWCDRADDTLREIAAGVELWDDDRVSETRMQLIETTWSTSLDDDVEERVVDERVMRF